MSAVAIVGSFRTDSVGCWAAAAVSALIDQKVMVAVVVVEFEPSAQIIQWVVGSEFARIEMVAAIAVPVRFGQTETGSAVAVAAVVYFVQRIQCFAGLAGFEVFGQISSFQPGFDFECLY